MPESPIVYHGTFAEFKKFDKKMMGSSTGAPSAFEGFFFATNKKVAESYASKLRKETSDLILKKESVEKELIELTGDTFLEASLKIFRKEYDKETDEKAIKLIELIQEYDGRLQDIEEMGGYSDIELEESGILKKARLDLKKPLIHDMKGEDYRDVSYINLILKAKSEGYDGVIIKNTYDGGDPAGSLELTDIYVAFDISQIKTINNNGNNATNLSIEQKYARIFGLPEEDIAHAAYDIFTGTLTVTYGKDKPRYKQKTVTRRATKEFADYFKAPIFIGKGVDYILGTYLQAKGKNPVVREGQGTEKVYYTSTNPVFGKMTVNQFIETEVEERGNYTLADVRNWMRKYNLSGNDLAIWVSPLKSVANRYNLPAEEWDTAENIPESEMSVYEIKGEEGFIILESDDGDEGYLFVFKNPLNPERFKVTEAYRIMIREDQKPGTAPGINEGIVRIIEEVKSRPWTVPEKRAEIAARLKHKADEIVRKMFTEIQSFRPLGVMSEIGLVMGAQPKKGVRIDTPIGATVFDEKRVPSRERVDRWFAEFKEADRIRGLIPEYAFALEARPNTVTGNYRVVEHARRLKEQGLLSPEEEPVLKALEKYWEEHPGLDRKEGYGVWAYNLEIMVPERFRTREKVPGVSEMINRRQEPEKDLFLNLKKRETELRAEREYTDLTKSKLDKEYRELAAKPLGEITLHPQILERMNALALQINSLSRHHNELSVKLADVRSEISRYQREFASRGLFVAENKESLIDTLLKIQPGRDVLIGYGDIPKDAERITLPLGGSGIVIERRGNLIAIGIFAGAAVVAVLYVQKDSQMIRIRPIPHQKMQTKTGEIVNTPEYNRWVERIKTEAPEYLPEWEKIAIKGTEAKQKPEVLAETTPAGIRAGDTIIHRTAKYTAVVDKVYKNGNAEITVLEAKGIPEWEKSIKEGFPIKIHVKDLDTYFEKATIKGTETKQPWEMTRSKAIAEAAKPLGSLGISWGEMRTALSTSRQSAESLHKDMVKLAIVEGKPVPPEVLKEYPDLTAKKKEPWQMTKEEYWRSGAEGRAFEGRGTSDFNHKQIIKNALSQGKPVPAEVLIDYPDLATIKKQPWELTYREFADLFEEVWGGMKFNFAERVGKPLGIQSQAGEPYHMIKGRRIGYSGSLARDRWRLAIVDKVLSEGKKVPEEVLAELSESLKHEKEKLGGTGMAEQYEEKPPSQEVKDWMKRALGIEDYKGGRHDRIQMLALLIQNSELGNIRSIHDAGSMALALGKDLGYGTPPPYGKSSERYYAEKIAAETGREVPIIKSSDIIKPPVKITDVKAAFEKHFVEYNRLSLLALTRLNDADLAHNITLEIQGLSREDALKIVPQMRHLMESRVKELEAQELKAKPPAPEVPKVDFWGMVKDLKITDVQVEFAPGEPSRGYKNIYLYTYAILENGKRVRMNEEIFKGRDVTEAQKLGLEYFRQRKLYMIGETVGQNVREDSFLFLNRYEDYVKQKRGPVQMRFEVGEAIAGGAPARQILTVTEPEGYYFGTQVEVMQGVDPELEPYFTGTVKRLLNNGELVEVHPEGNPMEVSVRVPVDRVNVVRLVEQTKPGVKPKKEIWQMTQREFNSTKVEKWQGIRNDVTKTITGGYLFVLLDEPKHEGEWVTRSTGHSVRNVSNRSQAVAKFHKEQVEKALFEGKPVPEDVLKEYPELIKPKEEKKLYRYYYRNRPPGIGTQPEGFVNHEMWVPVRTTPHGRTAFGWVEYDRPLTNEEISGYELFEDEVELPKLVKEIVQFAKTEGIDEAMKEVTTEYGRAVWEWLKSQKRIRAGLGQKEQIRAEIVRLAGITEVPAKTQFDPEKLHITEKAKLFLTALKKYKTPEELAQQKAAVERLAEQVPELADELINTYLERSTYLKSRGKPAKEVLTEKEPEDYYFGTEVTVEPEFDKPYEATIKRLLNNGTVVEVNPKGTAPEVSIRINIERVYVFNLKTRPLTTEELRKKYKPAAPSPAAPLAVSKPEIPVVDFWGMVKDLKIVDFDFQKESKPDVIKGRTYSRAHVRTFAVLENGKNIQVKHTVYEGESAKRILKLSPSEFKREWLELYKEYIGKPLSAILKENELYEMNLIENYIKQIPFFMTEVQPPITVPPAAPPAEPSSELQSYIGKRVRVTVPGKDFGKEFTVDRISGNYLSGMYQGMMMLAKPGEVEVVGGAQETPASTEELNRKFGALIGKAKSMWSIRDIEGWINRYADPRRSREDTILDLEGLIKTMEIRQPGIEAMYDSYIRSTMLHQGVLASPKFMSDEKIAQDIERNIQVSKEEARNLVPQFRAIAEKRINREEAESVKETFGIDVEQEAHNLGIDLADYAIIPAGNRVFLQHKTMVQRQYELKPPAGYMKRREEEWQEKYRKAAGRLSLTVKEPEDYYSGSEVTVKVGEPPRFLNSTLKRLLDRGETVEVQIWGETNTIKVPIDNVRVRELKTKQPAPAEKFEERILRELRTKYRFSRPEGDMVAKAIDSYMKMRDKSIVYSILTPVRDGKFIADELMNTIEITYYGAKGVPVPPVAPPAAKPAQTIEEIKQQVLNSIEAASTVEQLQPIIKGIGFLPLPEPEKQQLIRLYQDKYSSLLAGRPFGAPVKAEAEEKPKVIGAPTREELAERERRRKLEEISPAFGQVKLGGAVTTAVRLGMFEPGAMEKAKAEAEMRRRIEASGLPYGIHPVIKRLAESKEQKLMIGAKRGKETVEDLVLSKYIQYCPPGTIIDNRKVPKVPDRWWVYPAKLRACMTEVEQKIAAAGMPVAGAGIVKESQRFRYTQRFRYSIYQDGRLFANEDDPTEANNIYNMLTRTFPSSRIELRENFVHPRIHQKILKESNPVFGNTIVAMKAMRGY